MTLFTQLLSDPYALRRYAIVLRPYDDRSSPTEGVIDLYYSENGLVTLPSDDPPNQYFEGRIASALSFRSEIINQSRIRGDATPSYGDIVLRNGDSMGQGDISDVGTLDFLDDLYWNGREIDVYLGGQLSDGTELQWADYGKIGTFIAEGIDVDTSEVRLRIRDPRLAMQVPVLLNTYAGTGDYEGGVDLEGKPKPLLFGRCRFVAPVYLGVIGGKYTFQVNDGEILDIEAVYSNGAALTRVDSTPGAGQYSVSRDTGTFQLGGSTLDTIITCDVSGVMDNRTSPSVWLQYSGEICEYVASHIAGVPINQASVAALDLDAPYTVGVYLNSQTNCDRVVSEVMEKISGYPAFNRAGQIILGRITDPGDSVDTYDSTSIIDVKRIATVPPAKQVIIEYARCWRPMTFVELAFTIPEDIRSFAQEAYRSKSSTNDPMAVQIPFPLALEERFATLIDDEADALAEANRLQALYGSQSKIFSVTVKTQPFQRNLGETVTIQDNRLGLSFGQKCVIIGMDELAASGEITLTVWAL